MAEKPATADPLFVTSETLLKMLRCAKPAIVYVHYAECDSEVSAIDFVAAGYNVLENKTTDFILKYIKKHGIATRVVLIGGLTPGEIVTAIGDTACTFVCCKANNPARFRRARADMEAADVHAAIARNKDVIAEFDAEFQGDYVMLLC